MGTLTGKDGDGARGGKGGGVRDIRSDDEDDEDEDENEIANGNGNDGVNTKDARGEAAPPRLLINGSPLEPANMAAAAARATNDENGTSLPGQRKTQKVH